MRVSAQLLLAVAAVASAIAASDFPAFPHLRTSADRRWVEVEGGRERLWHGVNVVYKGVPFHPQTQGFDPTQSYSDVDQQLLQSLGLNVIRMGTMWRGVEPSQGQYNDSYLDVMQGIAQSNTEYGIWTVVDFHQDLLSEKYCGEGVPPFAAVSRADAKGFPEPLAAPYAIDNSTGFPVFSDCNEGDWAEYQVPFATASAYENLYTGANDGGVARTAFGAYWAKLAATFKEQPGIVGYELFNEPWAGDMWLDPLLMIPGVADVQKLTPLYDFVQSQIRAVDQSHVILFAGVTWDDFGVGFQRPPGGEAFKNMSALAYHFYLPPQLTLNGTFKARAADLERLGVGGFLTEFDIGAASCCELTQQTMDACDALLQSWIGWEYKTFDPITGYGASLWNSDGSFNANVAAALSRTYAQATAGVIVSMSFDHSAPTRDFVLTFAVTDSVTNPLTEIYLSQTYHYPNGYTVTISPSDAATYSSPRTNVLHVVNEPGLLAGEQITVTVTAVTQQYRA